MPATYKQVVKNADGTFSYPKGVIFRISSQMARRRRKAKVPNRKATVKLIKKVIASETETKFVAQTVASGNRNAVITDADIIGLLPKLVQDQGEGNAFERMGIKISPRKLKISCHACLTPDLNRSMAITVHCFVLQSTVFKNQTQVVGNVAMNRLLRTGNFGQYFPFDGNIDVAMLPINNSDFKLLKHFKFNLAKNTGFTQDEVTAGNQPLGGPVSKAWTFDLNPPAKLTYEQDNNSPRVVYYPNGYAPFMVFGYTHQDTSVPDNINQDLRITVSSQLYYDDA